MIIRTPYHGDVELAMKLKDGKLVTDHGWEEDPVNDMRPAYFYLKEEGWDDLVLGAICPDSIVLELIRSI